MDPSVNVVVDWCSEKRENPPLSGVYSTVAKFPEDAEQWPREAWSIVLEFSPTAASSDGRRIARARFLSDAAPAERLRSGRTFELYEGFKKTATVTVS